MIQKIIESIIEKVHEKYPDFEYLTEFLPEDMSRPSVFCEFVKLVGQKRMSRSVLKKTELYQITYFATCDEYGKAKKSDINEVLSRILDIFSDGVISVDERAYKITVYSGGTAEAEGFIDITVERTEYTSRTEAEKKAEEASEKMQKIILKAGGEVNELT